MAAVRERKSAAATVRSVTRVEIERFWRRKRMEEEDHLLAAQKAAARVKARALTEGDYRRFEESLWAVIGGGDRNEGEDDGGDDDDADGDKGARGIKDWWTKSKYAYLNQPAIKSMGEGGSAKKATSTYIPHKACFFYSFANIQFITTSSLGVY